MKAEGLINFVPGEGNVVHDVIVRLRPVDVGIGRKTVLIERVETCRCRIAKLGGVFNVHISENDEVLLGLIMTVDPGGDTSQESTWQHKPVFQLCLLLN